MLGHSCLADLPHCAATASGSIALLPVELPLAHSPAAAATALPLLPLRRPPLLPVAGTVKGRQVMAGKSACSRRAWDGFTQPATATEAMHTLALANCSGGRCREGTSKKRSSLKRRKRIKGKQIGGKGGWRTERQGFNPGELPLRTRSPANKKKQKCGRQEGLQRGALTRR